VPSSIPANPLLSHWETPLGLPPFGALEPEHFEPALTATMTEHLAEVDAIATSTESPTFANTVLAFDRAGAGLARASRVFSNLCAADTSPALQVVERTMAPKLAAHRSNISLHTGIFARVDALHATIDSRGLTPIERRMLERVHLDFVRGGARFTGPARERVGVLAQELATLHTQFAQNVLADEASWHLELPTEHDRAGLPEWLQAAMRGAASDLGLPAGSHVVTLSRSLIVPFLETSTRRDLREIAFVAWTQRGESGGATDNRQIITDILVRRRELARLHGHDSFTTFQLDDMMAKTPAAVSGLLDAVWAPARAAAIAEYEALNERARRDGQPDTAPWDWRFYAEGLRAERFDLDDDEVKPYFALDRVLEAAFDCAGRLFGLRFVERPDIASYHPDVRTFAVYGGDQQRLGVFLSDNYARPSKRSGAWMSAYRLRADHLDGDESLPVIANHNNFAKAEHGPTLLSIDDARTLFHEFGHGLHGLLSVSPFQRLAGTNVLRDFVELPSQLFEHWLLEPEVLRRHARHVETGEVIPDELVARVREAAQFNQGFATVEYTACAHLDLALHQEPDPGSLDLDEFERTQLAELGMPPAMVLRHRLPHFLHLFSSSGYASAYYVYLWAEVLDADAYDAFAEAGDPFDPSTAQRLEKFVYSSGDTIEPGAAYRSFRGRDAGIEPLLRGRGLLT
jgi:peptidyl-dipeptidase Dcp